MSAQTVGSRWGTTVAVAERPMRHVRSVGDDVSSLTPGRTDVLGHRIQCIPHSVASVRNPLGRLFSVCLSAALDGPSIASPLLGGFLSSLLTRGLSAGRVLERGFPGQLLARRDRGRSTWTPPRHLRADQDGSAPDGADGLPLAAGTG